MITIVVSLQLAAAYKFDIFPLNINFNSYTAMDSTIIVFGDFGSFLISNDNGTNWEQFKAFKNGNIKQLFIGSDRFTAFSDAGDISVSYNNGIDWIIRKNLNDSILSVIKTNKGYLVRARKKLILLDEELKLINEFKHFSKPLFEQGNYYFDYKYSTVYVNNRLIVEIDSSKFLRFDDDLNFIDILSLKEAGLCSSCYNVYMLFTDGYYIYFKEYETIYRTVDFKVFEKIYYSKLAYTYKVIDNKIFILIGNAIYSNASPNRKIQLYSLSYPDTAKIISEFRVKELTVWLRFNDWNIIDDKFIVVGPRKFISITKLSDSLLNIVSDFSGGTPFVIPDRIHDSSYLFYQGYYHGYYRNPIYRTDNNGITFKPIVDKRENSEYFQNTVQLQFKYFDKDEKKLIMGGVPRTSEVLGGVSISNDFGKTFKYKELPEFNFNTLWWLPDYDYVSRFPNLQKLNENFVTVSNIIEVTTFFTYDKEFNLKSRIIKTNSNMIVDFVHSQDTNTFLVHYKNTKDTSREIAFTTNKGIDWEILRKYTKNDSLLYYYELSLDGNDLVLFFIFDPKDSVTRIEVLNINDKSFHDIYSYKVLFNSVRLVNNEKVIQNGICMDSGVIYLAIEDTIFIINDLYDRSKWEYIKLPPGGNIKRTFQKFDDTFFARYSDDENKDNIYWIKIYKENIPKKAEIQVQDVNFGQIQINEEISLKTEIFNSSADTSLYIYGFSLPNDSVFQTNLPVTDSLKPIIIEPKESYELTVTFKPNSVKTYSDSIVFYSNANDSKNVSLLKGEGIDTIETKVEAKINELTYFYFLPPYPIPAKDYLKTTIYWDNRYPIENMLVSVYNIYGEIVDVKTSFNLDKEGDYKGYLRWDCSELSNGFYLINIKHGNNSVFIKVIIHR